MVVERTALRPLKAWFLGGSLAGPDIGPARPVGGTSARAKCPTGRLAKLWITNPVRVAEGLPGISARRW